MDACGLPEKMNLAITCKYFWEEELVNKRFFVAVLMLCSLGAMTGCATNHATATLMADADLQKVKSVYIVHSDTDTRNVDKQLQKAFQKRGIEATVGPAHAPPYTGDASVTYVDKWFWDITMYLLELTVTVRNPGNDFPMATGNSLHTSLTRKSPEEMTDEVVGNILAAKR